MTTSSEPIPIDTLDSPDACSEQAALLHRKGHLRDAMACYERALALDPSFAKAHFKIGNLLIEEGRPEEAVARYQRALELVPDYVGAHNNLANVLSGQGRLQEAVAHYHRAIALRTGSADLHYNLGNALVRQGKLDEAAAQYIRALALKPDFAVAHYSLATIFARHGHLERAIASCSRAVELKPDFTEAFAQLVMLKMQACDWRSADADAERVLELMRQQPGKIPPANLLCQTSTAAEQLQCARAWAQVLKAGSPGAFTHPRSPRHGGKIRLGYLCADYHAHPLAQLIVSMIEWHDRSGFEVWAYSIGPDDGSDMRRRVEAAFDRFIEFRDVEDRDAAQRIHADGVDILIDLTGYAENGRTRILTSRPAPVQVNGIGYTGTTGADFVDYILVDPFVAPFDQQPFYSERLVHLPHCYMPSDDKRKIADLTPTREECGLPREGFVFCCFNNRYKLTAAFFDVWARLLQAVPGSVFWLLEWRSSVKENLQREARRRGVEPERLVFMPPVPLPDFLARNRLADLFLDTLPYNAHTTANDALWAGLPVLTCVGKTFAGRVAGSLLHSIGLPELMTNSLDEYERLAIRLAQAPGLLSELRRRLERNRASAPLFDMKRYARDVEAAYRTMWSHWCDGRPPTSFAVAGA